MSLFQHAGKTTTLAASVAHVKSWLGIALGTGLLLAAMEVPALAQGATGGLAGTVKDAQGGVLPGATITLVSETRGTRPAPVVTNNTGDFRFPNLTPDRYTIQIEMPSFKTMKQTGLEISPGPPLALGTITLQIGGTQEIVDVRARAPMIQAATGERSFTISTDQVSDLPILGRDYAMLLQLAPGVNVSTGLTSASAASGSGGTNFMMDGVTQMDPGVNREAQKVSVEAIAEVKVLTSSYQAEYGRSSGLQISAVTKSGTNRLRGAVYDVDRNSKWDAQSKTAILNGDPKQVSKERDWGWSIGGPVGRPGGSNKLFYFWNQEFNPRTQGGSVTRYRMPTALERKGDFSQSTDNNGNLYNLIKDPSITGTCSTTVQTACFADGGVLGRIPANRLYPIGLAILNWWPMPNLSNVPVGQSYNWERVQEDRSIIGWQPIIRFDYQPTQNLRLTYNFKEYQQPKDPQIGTIPGFNDAKQDDWGIWSHGATVNYTFGPTTFLEASFGRNTHHQEGCSITGGAPSFCTGGLKINDAANRYKAGLGDLPILFPDAGVMDPRYRSYDILNSVKPSLWDGTRVSPVPSFAWGSRVANAPPNMGWPGFILDTVANTFNVNLTKVQGTHTLKAGYYFYESVQRRGNANIIGTYTFSNDTNNPFDTTFGFTNAAVGVFSSLAQTSRWTEGAYTALNNEGYLQDNWKVNRNLTLDYGMRVIFQQPQHDQLHAGSNFLPDTYKLTSAPRLYVWGCANGVYPCSGSNRQVMDPGTGQFLGTTGNLAVGTKVPNTGDVLNGLHVPGEDITKTLYKWPAVVLAPRVGAAWDLSGQQKFVVRGGSGLFFDRPSASAVYTTVNNPPTARSITVRYGTLQDLGRAALVTESPSSINAFDYDGPMPASVQWNGGVQMMLPLDAALDVSYTGQHAFHTQQSVDINNIDIGMAFRPEFQDPTQTPAGPTTSLVNTNVNQVRFYKGYGTIEQTKGVGGRWYHAIQISLNRRFRDGLSFGFNDTIGISDRSNVALRIEHDYVARTVTVRADQARAQELLGNNNPRTHAMKANFIWSLPRISAEGSLLKAIGLVANDWQLAGIWTGLTGSAYAINFSYQNGGGNLNLTGSPDVAARTVLLPNVDLGGGCNNKDPYRQFNTAAFQGPAVGSVGLDSSNGYLWGCFQSTFDMSISRTIRLPKGRNIQLRADMFNALNQQGITGRINTMNLTSPSDPVTITNLPFNPDGSLIDARSRPRGAGVGVANAYQAGRTVQLQVRFSY